MTDAQRKPCSWSLVGEQPWPLYRCSVHGAAVEFRRRLPPENLDRYCRSGNAELLPCNAVMGPGDYLHAAIKKWTGAGPTAGCRCHERIKTMNAWGAAECRRRIDEIAGWLLAEAAERGWPIAKLPGARWAVKRLVLGAIREAERG